MRFGKVMVSGMHRWQPDLIICKAVILITAALGLLGFSYVPQKTATPEYQVKAVFLYNIAQFIEWPMDSFAQEKSPIIIGLLGTDPFGSYLDETVQGEEINGHPIIVQRYASASAVKKCHILFIHRALAPKLSHILKNLKGKGILTVSDANNFAQQGGMVRFFTQDSKIRIRINLDAAKAEKITISSKLLRLAEIVDPKY
jgi:hypothetical protein